MAGYNIRLSSMLTFDEEKEADIIQVIEKLNSMHKTGNFLSNLIRVSLDCPEILDQSNGKFTKGSTLVDLEQYGLTYNRRALADKNAKDILEMKKKVDAMYEMTLKLYTLALMNKHLGLEQKAENNIIANFMVEKQLGDLKKSLGVTLADNAFISNKVKDTKQLAEDSLEFILNTYSDIIDNVKDKLTIQNDNSEIVSMIAELITKQSRQVIVTEAPELKEQIVQPVVTQPIVQQNVGSQPLVEENIQDEVIDFGNEDMSMLDNFFGA